MDDLVSSHRTAVGVRAKSWRSLSLAFTAAAALASFGLMAPAGAAAAETKCPEPPRGDVLFHGSLTEGVALFGKVGSTRNITGTIKCGQLALATLHYTIPAGDITFQPNKLVLFGINFLALPAEIKVEAPAEGQLKATGEEEFSTIQTLPITANVRLLFFTCTVAFTPTLTTGTSGSLTGKPLKGNPLKSLKGELVANEYEVPAIKTTSSCPSFIAGLSNFLLGLPLKPGASSLTSAALLEVGE